MHIWCKAWKICTAWEICELRKYRILPDFLEFLAIFKNFFLPLLLTLDKIPLFEGTNMLLKKGFQAKKLNFIFPLPSALRLSKGGILAPFWNFRGLAIAQFWPHVKMKKILLYKWGMEHPNPLGDFEYNIFAISWITLMLNHTKLHSF